MKLIRMNVLQKVYSCVGVLRSTSNRITVSVSICDHLRNGPLGDVQHEIRHVQLMPRDVPLLI